LDDPGSIPGSDREGNYFLRHSIQTSSGAHPDSYPMVIGGLFDRGEVTGTWSWPITSI